MKQYYLSSCSTRWRLVIVNLLTKRMI